jgi:hypothetical protein
MNTYFEIHCKVGENYSVRHGLKKFHFCRSPLSRSLISCAPTPSSPLYVQPRPCHMESPTEAVSDEQVHETDRSEDGGAIPTGFDVDSSSQSATSRVLAGGAPSDHHGSSSVPHVGPPRANNGVFPPTGHGQGLVKRRGAPAAMTAAGRGAGLSS